jgi:hypothetical protein
MAVNMVYNLAGSNNLYAMDNDDKSLFFTLGAFPIQEIALSPRDKWLYGVQIGTRIRFENQSVFKIGLAYYNFDNITGRRNAFDSRLLDYTAPQFMQKGNSLFDIREDSDVATDLWALASDYDLFNLTSRYDWVLMAPLHLIFDLDFVYNTGYDKNEIQQRTNGEIYHWGVDLVGSDPYAGHVTGYQFKLTLGWPVIAERRSWQAYWAYRYLERDAVFAAFTDSDFHLGGTDAKGFVIGADYALDFDIWASLKWISSDAIDGAPYAINTVQVDLSTRF